MTSGRADTSAKSSGFKLSYLLRGTPGHPLHPAIAHITLGAYVTGAIMAVVGKVGSASSEYEFAKAWWLAILVGFIAGLITIGTGFADFFAMSRESPARRNTIMHIMFMMPTVPAFGLTLVNGHAGFQKGVIGTVPLVLTLVGLALVMIGGFLGGVLVYKLGVRVEPVRELREAAKAENANVRARQASLD